MSNSPSLLEATFSETNGQFTAYLMLTSSSQSFEVKSMKGNLVIPARYFQDSTPPTEPCREECFIRREVKMALPVEQTALVLVDIWNTHFIESWLERARRVTTEVIVPALAAARRAGLAVVHAPSPEIAAQYTERDVGRPAVRVEPPAWPPVKFRARSGSFAVFRGPREQPPGIGAHWEPYKERLGMSSAVEVQAADYVIASGEQLHELAHQLRIMHLIYAGFATNWCVLNRDYGIRAIAQRGYNIVLLREATMGVEYPDTLQDCLATELAVREVETQLGFSTANAAFIAACDDLKL